MSVVQLFDQTALVDKGEASALVESNDNKTGEVVELFSNRKLAHRVAPNPAFRQIEAALIAHGVDFRDSKIKSDYKIVTFLIQGILDRSAGESSDRCFLLDTIRELFGYEEPLPNDTDELFGDLLGRLDCD